MSFSQAFARAGIKVEQPKKQSEIIDFPGPGKYEISNFLCK